MRCLIAASGSRGDVEPFALLAEALAARGHAITLALDVGYHEGAPAVAGVRRVALGELGAEELQAVIDRALRAPTPMERSRLGFLGFVGDRQAALTARVAELVAAGCDLAILSDTLVFAPPSWTTPTALVIHVPVPRATFMARAGLPHLRLTALTPQFIPPGDTELRTTWTHTGFWIRQRPYASDPRVEAYLAAGTAPVFLTMGSMRGFDAPALTAAFVAGARAEGQRAIVQRGWAGLDASDAPDVLTVDEVDYAALFPRCAAIFMHGGTGTVAHALRAGRPIGVLPIVGDQLMWALTLRYLGNGLPSVDAFAPSAAAFAVAMRHARIHPRPAAAAAALAARIAAEDGLATACDALEAYAAR